MAYRNSIDNSRVKTRIIKERGRTCQYCGTLSDHLELDHIIPLWNGGSHIDANLQLLCYECHKTKTISESMLRKTINLYGELDGK